MYSFPFIFLLNGGLLDVDNCTDPQLADDLTVTAADVVRAISICVSAAKEWFQEEPSAEEKSFKWASEQIRVMLYDVSSQVCHNPI